MKIFFRGHWLFPNTKIFFLFFNAGVLFSPAIEAQQIRWSAPITNESKLQYLKIIGSDENNFYILRSNLPFETERDKSGFKSRKYQLSCYSMTMVLKWDKLLTAPATEAKILAVQMVNNRLLVASREYTKEHVLRLYLQYLDETGNYTGRLLKLDEFKTEKIIPIAIGTDYKPDLIISKDESLLCIAYRLIPADENSQVFRFAVCDSAMNLTYQKEITIDAGEKYFSAVNVALSDSGNIYLLGIRFTTTKKVKAPGESFYQLHAYLSRENRIQTEDIKTGEKFLTDAGLAVDNLNNAAVVAGFYSDKNTYSTAGVFYFALKTGSPEKSEVRSAAFSESFLKKFISEKKENNNRELVNYSIDRILLRKDGGAVLVAESYNTFTRSYFDYYTQVLVSHTYYNYGNIIVLSVNPDGGMLWSDVLSKDHNSTDDEGYFSSYCSAVYGPKMYYIYNKYIESKTSVMLSYTASNGEQNTLVLFNEVEHVMAVPKAALQIEQDVLLLPALKENQMCIARINF